VAEGGHRFLAPTLPEALSLTIPYHPGLDPESLTKRFAESE
jgi:hypothetical protein